MSEPNPSEELPSPSGPPPEVTPPVPSLAGAEPYTHESVSHISSLENALEPMTESAVEPGPDDPAPPAPVPYPDFPDPAPVPPEPVLHEPGRLETPAASASHRLNLVPPDSRPASWWARHQRAFYLLEWIAAALLLGTGLYFLILLLFFPPQFDPPAPPPPTRSEFRRRLRSLPPIGARPEWRVEAKEGRWRAVVVHHSATPGGSAEAFDKFHREERKWANGLGYHFVIGNGNGMADGEVAVGHRWRDQMDGAHVRSKAGDNANAYSIGVVLVGNFEESLPSEKQLAALTGLLTFLRAEYGIGLAAIAGHGEVAANHTACPGTWFFMDEVLIALANP